MKKGILLLAASMMLTVSTGAQQRVQQYLRVSDSNFNVKDWQDDNNPNESNPVDNSFTIPTAFGAVAWNFGSPNFWDPGVDMSKYEKLVIRLKSVVGNNLQFRIFDYGSLNGNGGNEYLLPDDIVEMGDEVEYMVDLTQDLEYQNGTGMVDKTNIKRFTFWNYWDVNGDKTNPNNEHYDPNFVDANPPGPGVTVTISAMYLERTLANGEKDYVNLLADHKISFTDDYLTEGSSYMDNTGVMHLNENAEGGLFFDESPADWSHYKYLVVVPKKPWADGDPTVRYVLTDAFDDVFDAGTLRWCTWNRARAAVQDLTTITSVPLDDNSILAEFDTKQIASLKWSQWGGVQAIEYPLAAVWLSNTAPNYSTDIGEGTDNTGDYVIDNSAEGTITTLTLPFASAICGADVYEIAGIDDPANPTELYARPYMGILAAGKPYIIRTNSNRNVTAFRAGASEVSVPEANGALCADAFTTYYVDPDKNYLVLNSVGDTFEAVVDRSKRVNSNTAYIDCSKLVQATEQTNGLVFSVTGATGFTPNAIAKVTTAQRSADNAVYDLAGRRVSHPTKGIYIMNGKKFIVK